MNIVGIVAEYNPFHKGHQYHIETAKRLTRADYTVVIMSGPFVQRGGCAIADKYTRARSALLCGADLVLELPVLYAVSSAEGFAQGAVGTLNQLGIITHLAFGSESVDLSAMQKVAQVLADEPDNYRQVLKNGLANGLSFPQARELALKEVCPEEGTLRSLQEPNSILALEYCKSLYRLQSSIQPVVIKRAGSSYHQLQKDSLYSSASSIRAQIKAAVDDGILLSENEPPFPAQSTSGINPIIRSQLPDTSASALQEAFCHSFPLFDEDLSALMRYALLQVPHQDYTPYLDVSEDLSNRIKKHLFEYESFHSFASLLKTKELTYSRICRCLLHILLGITKEYADFGKEIPYVRVLGMKASASGLLGQIKQHSKVPVITNPASYLKQDCNRNSSASDISRPVLSTKAQKLLMLDCRAAHIQNGVAGEKFRHTTECEYTRRFLKL